MSDSATLSASSQSSWSIDAAESDIVVTENVINTQKCDEIPMLSDKSNYGVYWNRLGTLIMVGSVLVTGYTIYDLYTQCQKLEAQNSQLYDQSKTLLDRCEKLVSALSKRVKSHRV